MLIFSNPIFIKIIIAIGVAALLVGTCCLTYIYAYRRGHTDCRNNSRAKRRARHKSTRDGDIRVLNSIEPRKRYAEAESVRIIATHAPKIKEEDTWM